VVEQRPPHKVFMTLGSRELKEKGVWTDIKGELRACNRNL
jgi:hypothetical protein